MVFIVQVGRVARTRLCPEALVFVFHSLIFLLCLQNASSEVDGSVQLFQGSLYAVRVWYDGAGCLLRKLQYCLITYSRIVRKFSGFLVHWFCLGFSQGCDKVTLVENWLVHVPGVA